MVNAGDDRYSNDPDVIITHCIYVLKPLTVSLNMYNFYVSIKEKNSSSCKRP